MKKTISTLLAAAMAVSSLASGEEMEDAPVATPQTYVLVHGAWQAPYVWDAVKANLTSKGNKVIVVELPGHGTDKTLTHTLSIDAYRDKVVEAIATVDEKVILVGHSMGGMVISAVAEKIPSKISKLVYIGAFLPANGQALIELANTDAGSKLGPLLIESADKLTLDVKADSLTSLFINDGDAAVKQRVIDGYRAEPAIPFINKVTLTNERFGSVDKVYIKTLQDLVISPALQDRMIAAAGIRSVYSVNSSHSPFLAQPQAVSDLLLSIGQQQTPPPENDNAVARLTKYEVKPAYEAAFRKAISDYVVHSLAQDNNILTEGFYERDKPSVLWMMERWSNRAAFNKSNGSIAFKAIGSLSNIGLLAPATTIDVKDLEPVSQKQWRSAAGKGDKPITIMLFVESRPGTEGAFEEVYHTAMSAFRSEPGVINYQLSRFTTDNTRFVTYEKFRNDAAFQYHLDFPPIKPVLNYLNTSIRKQPFQDGIHTLIEFAPLAIEK